MINKLLAIKNIGVLNEYKVDKNSWNTEFKKNNFIYAENGQGKTTLSIIFESLAKDQSDLIAGRKTLGADGVQKIELMSGKDKIKYENNTWNKIIPNIEIFNSRFVLENLYVGDTVKPEQKRKLHSFVLGEEGVNLINQINSIEEEVKIIQNQLKYVEKSLRSHIKEGTSISEFISLSKVDDNDIQIINLENTLRLLEESESIIKHPDIKADLFHLPKLQDIISVLSRGYEDISKEAEDRVSKHIKSLDDKNVESWIDNGLKIIRDEKCPFCKSDILNNEMFAAYKKYFNAQYNEFKESILIQIDSIKKSLSEVNISRFQNLLSENARELEFWKKKINFDLDIEVFSDEIIVEIENLSKMICECLDVKKADILTPLSIPIEIKDYLEYIDEKINMKQNFIKNINQKIQDFKLYINSSNKQELIEKVTMMKLIKLRFSDDIDAMCTEYTDNSQKKNNLDEEKKRAKILLEKYTDEFKQNFCSEINTILGEFGAGFSICEIDTDFRNGPKFEFKLLINGMAVSMNDSKNRDSIPQFKNTLSEGDKTTLAFAFFIAKIRNSNNISNTIVVVDDPISSLDIFRLNMTARMLSNLLDKVQQLFVLSHDLKFVKNYYDRSYKSHDILLLEIKNKQFRKFDIDKVHLSDYFINYFLLDDYFNGNSNESEVSVARAIRPLIEANLRMRYPKHFKCDSWLGDFIKMVRNANPSDPYYCVLHRISEIEELNEYSKKFHHDKNLMNESEQISSIELKRYVGQAIQFCSR